MRGGVTGAEKGRGMKLETHCRLVSLVKYSLQLLEKIVTLPERQGERMERK